MSRKLSPRTRPSLHFPLRPLADIDRILLSPNLPPCSTMEYIDEVAKLLKSKLSARGIEAGKL